MAVAKLMTEVPPVVMPRNTSDKSEFIKAPLPGMAAILAI